MARLPPDASTPAHDRSVWKGLVVQADEFAPEKPARVRWWLIVVLLLVLAGAGFAIAQLA